MLLEVGVDFVLGDEVASCSDAPASGFTVVDFLLDVLGVVLVACFVAFVDVRVDLALVGFVLGVVFFVAGGVAFLTVNEMFQFSYLYFLKGREGCLRRNR